MRAETGMSYSYSTWREPFGVAETPAEYVFHRPRLYLETTIPSYLTARLSRDPTTAARQRITMQWWNSWRTQFDIYISDAVLEEAAAGNRQAADRRLRLLAYLPTLVIDDRSAVLQARLMKHCGLPARASVDAEHVAVAAVHSMEFLLTWNFAHLVNPQFASRIKTVCEAEGFSCPLLWTPEQLLLRYENARTGE